MTDAGRASLAILAAWSTAALALRAADALASQLAGVPRGVRVCASLDEAEARTGLELGPLRRALGEGAFAAEQILRVRTPAVAVTLRPTRDDAAVFTFFRSAGPVPALLRPPLPAFHALEISLAADKTAALRAATLADGSVVQDLEWSEDTGQAALRTRGRTVDLLRLARRMIEGAR